MNATIAAPKAHKTNSITREVNAQINRALVRADYLASQEVERLARAILQKHLRTLSEFIMVNGAWYFKNARGEVINDTNLGCLLTEKYYVDFLAFMQWDDRLKVTGEPMRFTAYGPKITDW